MSLPVDPASSPSRGDIAKAASERGVVMSVVQGGMADVHPVAPNAPGVPSERYLGAFDLLESASKALEFLEARRDHLETALEDVSRRAEGAIAASADRAADWQRLATELKSRNADLERQIALLTRRAETAESERAAEHARAEASERRSSEVERLLRGLHDKVMSAFGQGTRAYDILAVVPGAGASNVVAMPKAG